MIRGDAVPPATDLQRRRGDTPGTLFVVVGPSGAGKDSVIDGLRARLDPDRFVFARRVITRPADAGGELHEPCDPPRFETLEAAGAFLASWRAHGLAYGLPASLGEALHAGRHVIANASRGAVASLLGRVPFLAVLEVDAPPPVIEARLRARGRETDQDIAARIARSRPGYPAGVPRLSVMNDLSVAIGVARAEAAVRCHLGLGNPAQLAACRKIAGQRLDGGDITRVLSAVVAGEFSDAMRDALLVACAGNLDDDELLAVARWRAGLMARQVWDSPMVVDKHSLGGTAGSRVTMVVVPIVAAHGLVMPKTSSRAITSASGTADAMEVLARVDLDIESMRRCVVQAGACIAWNGRLNHSVLDEAMHRLERPLALDTRRWSVASILSKKHSAGATHVVVDIPHAPGGKVGSVEEARSMAGLFESLGARMGMTVRAYPSDGSAPIGRGVGPALEARDVVQVLEGHPLAPGDLRDKSLRFAARLIALDPAFGGDEERALERARALLDSGAARRALQAIVDAQGPRPAPSDAGLRHREVGAPMAGVVARIRAPVISRVAREAGAPADVLAGVDLCCRPGEFVQAGQPLYRVQGRDASSLDRAMALAAADMGIDVVAAPSEVPSAAAWGQDLLPSSA